MYHTFLRCLMFSRIPGSYKDSRSYRTLEAVTCYNCAGNNKASGWHILWLVCITEVDGTDARLAAEACDVWQKVQRSLSTSEVTHWWYVLYIAQLVYTQQLYMSRLQFWSMARQYAVCPPTKQKTVCILQCHWLIFANKLVTWQRWHK